jgi:hypothetical protein
MVSTPINVSDGVVGQGRKSVFAQSQQRSDQQESDKIQGEARDAMIKDALVY